MRKNLIAIIVALLVALPLAQVFAQGGERTALSPDNAANLTELMRLGRGSVDHVAFSADGATVYVAGSVGVWAYPADNLGTETEPPLIDVNSSVRALALNPDGSVLTIVSNENIQHWDTASVTQNSISNASFRSDSFAYSADGSQLVFNNGYSGIGLWDIASDAETLRLDGNFNVNGLAVSADGGYIAASGADNKVYVWDVAAGETHHVFEGHTNTVSALAFSPDNAYLASVSYDESVRVWDLAAKSELAAVQTTNEVDLERVNSVAFSPDGSVLATGHDLGGLRFWNASDLSEIAMVATATGAIMDISFSPDGAQVATAGSDEIAALWDVASATEVARTVGHTDYMDAIAFSPDSTQLAISDYDEQMWIWDTGAMQELHLSPVITEGIDLALDNVINVTFSHDGTLLAGADGFDVGLWDPATTAPLRRFDGDGIVSALAFSPDDTLLAYVSSSGLYVFDVQTGALLASLEEHTDWVDGVAFSPDQTMIATASRDGTVRIWGLE